MRVKLKKSYLPLVMLEKRISRKNSFTLLELILAVAIYSVIILVLVSGLNLSLKVYKRMKDSEVFKAGDFLDEFSSDFRSSYVFVKNSPIKFIASGNSLKFIRVSSLSDNLYRRGECELKTVEYLLAKGENNLWTLYRKERPFFAPSEKKKEKHEEMLDSLLSFRFSYFDGKGWKSVWDSPYKLPCAVRVDIKLKRNKKIEALSTVIDRI